MQAVGWVRTRVVHISVTFVGSSRPSSGRLAGGLVRQQIDVVLIQKAIQQIEIVSPLRAIPNSKWLRFERRFESRNGFALKGQFIVERVSP